jgi:hypothetical protein
MTPEATIDHLAELLEALPVFSEDGAYAAMEAAGIPSADADRAYKFTQIASGRMLLAGIVAKFSNDYFWLNRSGEVVESGQLQDEPYFVAATKLVNERPAEWMGSLGAMSADFSVTNQMLKRGSKPGNLETGPIVLFREYPTAAGMEKANLLIATHLKAATPLPRKPRWKFW